MSISIIDKINLKPAIKEIEDDRFWLFAAHEWQRLLYDYIPNDTSQLRRNVEYRSSTLNGEIEYRSPYARFIYEGNKMVDDDGNAGYTKDGIIWWSKPGVKKHTNGEKLVMKNGYARWDEKAKSEKQDEKLVKSLQKYIEQRL